MGAIAQRLDAAAPRAGWWARFFAPPPAGASHPQWHVSPAIDVAAYHFSWAWILVPMLVFDAPWPFFYLYAATIAANLAHRHFGLPYGYLDGEVFRRFRSRLIWFPLACLAMLAATPILLAGKLGRLGFEFVGAAVMFSVLWNFWHVYMQKFGIMRLYLAKDPTPAERKPAAWIDKYFLLCWIPLYFVYLGPANKEAIFRYGRDLLHYTSAIIAFMERYQRWFLAPSIAIAAGGVGLWLWHEWYAHRFRNRARLSAAAGTLAISTALLWSDPVKAFIAFAFSHAAEYMVFVWAYQRRAYSRPRAAPCLLQRIVQHPAAWYLGFIGFFSTVAIIQLIWGILIATSVPAVVFFGMTGAKWFFYYAVFESFVHFYMDTFMWKMRRPEVRANI